MQINDKLSGIHPNSDKETQMSSTFKRIGLFLVLLALGLSIAGCDPDKAFFAGPEGLKITASGDRGTTYLTITAQENVFTVESDRVFWYSDVPNGQIEYVIVSYAVNSAVSEATIHQLVSKKPKD